MNEPIPASPQSTTVAAPGLFATSRLGQVAQTMLDEGIATGHQGMQDCANICLRRGHDPDPDMELMIRVALSQYANSRGINVLALPIHSAH